MPLGACQAPTPDPASLSCPRPVLSVACRSSSVEGDEWRQASHQFSHLLGAPSARPPGTRLRPLPAPSGRLSPPAGSWLRLPI